MNRSRKKYKEKGQALVEMALILPVLLLLLCGIIDFGWISYNKLSVSYVSREGARYAAVHASDANAVELVQDKVLLAAPEYLQDKIAVTVSFSNPSSPRQGDVTVTVVALVDALTPVAGTIFGQSTGIALEAECVMKVE